MLSCTILNLLCSFKLGCKRQVALLWEDKSSVVATDAKPRAEISSLDLCRGAKEENFKLTDAFIPRRRKNSNKFYFVEFLPRSVEKIKNFLYIHSLKFGISFDLHYL